MAKPTGFSVPPSEMLSASDISGLMNINSSSNQSTTLSMEETKLKSHGGAAAGTSASAGSIDATVVVSASAGPSDWQANLLHEDDIPRLAKRV